MIIMNLELYFKRNYEFQYGCVNDENKYHDVMAYFKNKEDELFASGEEELFEPLRKVKAKNNSIVYMFLENVEKEIYSKTKCTQLYFLVGVEWCGFLPGAYWINPYGVFNVKSNTVEVEHIFSKRGSNAAILICTDVSQLAFMGERGFALALRQTGEIRQIAKSFFDADDFKEDLGNPNFIAHAAGLNINKLLVLDMLDIKL